MEVVNIRQDSYDVYIGRGSLWGNPYIEGKHGTREQVVRKYYHYAKNTPEIIQSLPNLIGKRLGCHCKPLACHGDMLVRLAREEGLL